ncbi:hypothetical protein I3I95_02630 [bacterium]|nr:hypothetical protein [bacterium]
MTSANPINPNAIEPGDDLVSPERYDPLAQQDMSYDPDAAALGISQEEAETQRAIESEEGFEPTLGDPNADHAPKEVVDDRPAEVRTAELFERMRPSRHELLDILRLCVEPTDVERVYASVDEAKAHHRSVYSGESLCDLLVRAGALERVEPQAQEPEVVVEDGVEYLRPAAPVAVRYHTLPAGEQMLEQDRPADRLTEALEKEPEYKPIYLRILRACSEGSGCSAKQLGDLVDHDPLVQSPRRWAAYFFGILGDCDALAWDGVWRTTETGLAGIRRLEEEGVTE